MAAAWSELTDQLRRVAPETAHSIEPPAGARALDDAEAATGTRWPDDLRQYFSLHDGQSDDSDPDLAASGQILPAHDLFGMSRMLTERSMMTDVWRALADGDPESYPEGYEGVAVAHPDAGTRTVAFLPEYLPISGSDGNFYVCDLRPGELHGCVRAFDRDGGDPDGFRWRSLRDMLAEVRTSIAGGSTIDGWEPRIREERLLWLPEGFDDTVERPTSGHRPLVVHTGYPAPPVDAFDHPFVGAGADIGAIARAVRAEAVTRYGASRVSGAHTVLRWVPQIPGVVADCTAIVGGVRLPYAVVITDTPDEFAVVEVPPEGLRFET